MRLCLGPLIMLTLHLVRHGPTANNAEKRYPLPEDDAPLSPQGREWVGRLQVPQGLGLVYSSPRLRARQTAELCGYPDPTLAPALAEAQFGVMAGHTWAELEEKFDALPRHWIDALVKPDLDFGPPQGETGRSFHARVGEWLAGLPTDGEAIAFSHSGTIQAILRLTVGLGAVATPPATWITLARGGGNWWLTRLQPVTYTDCGPVAQS